MRLFHSSPTESDPMIWFVWDSYHPDEPPVFFGSMEDAGGVADALNAREIANGFYERDDQ